MTFTGLAPDALFVLANNALAAIASFWPGSPVSPLPDRQYVTNGTVVWDAPQLAVHVERNFGTPEGDLSSEGYNPASPLAGIRGCTLAVHILRKVPDVTQGPGDRFRVPTPEQLTESARELLSDSVLVWNCLAAAQRSGMLATCNGLAYVETVQDGPQGFLLDTTTRVRVLVL